MVNKKTKKILLAITILSIAIISLAVIYLTVISPSFVGQTGLNGQSLVKYIEPEQLKALTEQPNEDIWIIDVRSENAYLKGHIPTAKSFPSKTIESRLSELPPDKNLIIYCETGGRVQVVAKKLEKHGYTNYMNWGGYKRWPYEWEKQTN